MNKPYTVKQLLLACESEAKKGNENKVIMISDDEEGNGYHYLWYGFTSIKTLEEPLKLGNKIYKPEIVEVDEKIANKENTIILG